MMGSKLIGFAAAGLSLALAGVALAGKRRTPPWWWFSVGMALLAAEAVSSVLALQAALPEAAAGWHRVRLMILALVPGTWLGFALCYGRGNWREFLHRWRWVLGAVYGLPVITVLLLRSALFQQVAYEPVSGQLYVRLGLAGRVVMVGSLLGCVLILVHLERTFRSAVGVMRWRIKYFMFGLALLFGARFYTASQALAYSAVQESALVVDAVALLLGSVLMVYSLVRTKLAESDIYPSHQVLQHSVTVAVAAAYLLVVGLLAMLVSRWGGDPAFPLKAFVLMVGLVGLAVVVLSDRVRQRTKLWVSRHFRRPVHDYRRIWLDFTAKTGALLEPGALGRAVLELIAHTFDLLSASLWVVDPSEGQWRFVASTTLTQEAAQQVAPTPEQAQALQQVLRQQSAPFDVDRCTEPWAEALRALNPDHFRKGGGRLCVPLVAAGELVGMIVVGDRVNGQRFSNEDLDLLKCIGDQVAASLRNLQLTSRLMQHKQLEALQNMSAFVIHELKNTAQRLSIMAQNVAEHFDNPAFRADCLQSLKRCVAEMDEQIQRLSLLRPELELRQVETDLNELVHGVLNEVAGPDGPAWVEDLQPVPRIWADPDQLRKVIVNLLLNAKEATPSTGRIQVRTWADGDAVLLAVSDTGCGMTPEFIRDRLFKPFQTTKKRGLGIGMFHSRAIVQAHQGRIEVESVEGQGTTFRVRLPIKPVQPAS